VSRENGFGKTMTINHDYGLKTRYGHLNKVIAKKGQSVKRGDTIALVGDTGRSTGPHLHYEIYLNGVAVDPLRYILN
jgi:murein DD-endopeptidase MepM/ murein hydrolase activator NlpD